MLTTLQGYNLQLGKTLKGSLNKATIAIENLLQGQAEALTQTAVAKALEGDSVALRLCMVLSDERELASDCWGSLNLCNQ